MDAEKRARVLKEFEHVINCNSLENGSGTPDFILAEYLMFCLETWNVATMTREKWYGRKRWMGGDGPTPIDEDQGKPPTGERA